MTDYAEAWRRTILGDHKSWVVFKHGTCVVLADPDSEAGLKAEAIAILRQYGPVIGLHGRRKRDHDGHELEVIHVEDRRGRARA